jgi:hypothetical protein
MAASSVIGSARGTRIRSRHGEESSLAFTQQPVGRRTATTSADPAARTRTAARMAAAQAAARAGTMARAGTAARMAAAQAGAAGMAALRAARAGPATPASPPGTRARAWGRW